MTKQAIIISILITLFLVAMMLFFMAKDPKTVSTAPMDTNQTNYKINTKPLTTSTQGHIDTH